MPTSTPLPRAIDPRGPRVNQGVLAMGLLASAALDLRGAIPVFALVLASGALLGPAWNPVIRVWSTLVRPRLAPPTHLEDPRPPRFAATLGAIVLGVATVALAAGRPGVAWALALVVVALAALAAISGVCVGCQIWLLAAARGDLRRSTAGGTVPDELIGPERRWILFTTPWCSACGPVERLLLADAPGLPVVRVDATERADLALGLGVRRSPTVLLVEPDGTVSARLIGIEAVEDHLTARGAGAGRARGPADLQ